MNRLLLMTVNDPAYFVAHHLSVALAVRDSGYHVAVAAPQGPGINTIRSHGLEFHPIYMQRGMVHPRHELKAVTALYRLYRRLSPALVYHISLRSIAYGTLAARLAHVPSVINVNTGLGYAFIDETLKGTLLRWMVVHAIRRCGRHQDRCDVYLNPDDRQVFLRLGLSDPETSLVIKGPGVDLREFGSQPEPDGVPLVVLPARMLWHKGVNEFVVAARQLLAAGERARFALVGDSDPGNPASVSRAQLQSWHAEGEVEWWGHRADMPSVMRLATLIVLPSYREGLGRVLIEGAAVGRALVATDAPGCREIVRHGENGLLVPVRDAAALAAAIQRLLNDAALRQRFARRSRQIVEAEFGNETICAQTLAVIRHLSLPPTLRSAGLPSFEPRPAVAA